MLKCLMLCHCLYLGVEPLKEEVHFPLERHSDRGMTVPIQTYHGQSNTCFHIRPLAQSIQHEHNIFSTMHPTAKWINFHLHLLGFCCITQCNRIVKFYFKRFDTLDSGHHQLYKRGL